MFRAMSAEPIRTTGHQITPSDIDEDAYKVLRRLHQFGYHAYLVGGGVRDLLLGRRPKDFDVVTSARPNEVRKLFRNCRLIGRRFRLAHILFGGGKVIETATFRARPSHEGEGDELITDDNEFGTAESDAYRRDFTVNGLFYDPATNEVIDYVDGLEDIDERVLRTIGEPGVRFREDPVRMLRAVKFAARLTFEIEPATRQAICDERGELRKAAVPRLLEEILRMLWGGAAARSFEVLAELDLLEVLLPEMSAFLGRPVEEPWHPMRGLLKAVNRRCNGQPALQNGVLLAALFWPLYQALIDDLPQRPGNRHLRPLADSLVGPAAMRLRIPRRDVATLVGVLEGQFRLEAAKKRRPTRAAFARTPHFPAIVDFLELRADAGELPSGIASEWRKLAAEFPQDEDRGRRRRSRPRGPRRDEGPRGRR